MEADREISIAACAPQIVNKISQQKLVFYYLHEATDQKLLHKFHYEKKNWFSMLMQSSDFDRRLARRVSRSC